MTSNKPKIGFIGTGVMGQSMVMNLLNATYDVNIYTRTKEKANILIEAGALWQSSVSELTKNTEVMNTMVGYPHDVEVVYFGDNGIIKDARANSYLVDMTTSSPKLAIKIYEQAAKNQLHVLDAPVSGGDIGAKNGTLAIMVGGNESAFHEIS